MSTYLITNMNTNEAPPLLQAMFVLLVILFLTFLIRKTYRNNSTQPPGPKGFPLVGNLMSLNPQLTTCFTHLAQRYGPIYTLKLGRKTAVVISSPQLAKEVLKHQDATFAYRDMPVVANETSYGGSNISWSPCGPTWRMLKGLASRELLSNNSLDSVYALRRREARLMVRYMYGRVGSPVKVGEQVFITILNVITSMLWGGRHVQPRCDGAEFRKVIVEVMGLLGKFNISDFYPGLARFDIQGLHKRMKVLTRRFDKIFDDIIEQRLEMDGGWDVGEGNKDFLHVLLKLKQEQNGKETFTMTHLKALLMDILTAGTDSTANTIEFALAEMINKPHILHRVQQELETIADKHSILEETTIQSLPYLHALMKETLRLHPALPLLAPHCPNSTCNVAGYEIPKGALVIVNTWAIHRDPVTWEDPLEFRPERFLDERFDCSTNDFKYFPFGSGRRSCPGSDMARRMFMYLVATLVHSFEWKLAQGEKMDFSEQYGLVLRKKIPLIVIPSPRLSNPSLYE